MKFSTQLKEHIKENHLLNHPFYQSWMRGELSFDTLKEYASQYYHHVAAFPRYISATHSNCENPEYRMHLLENLNDEEGSAGTPHPELWLNFAKGLGLDSGEVKSSEKKQAISSVINQFLSSGKKSYVEGLSALYAYEYQVPEIADSKIEGLKNNYGIKDKKSLEFFEVHKEADIFHREACEGLIDQFSEKEKSIALKSAKQASQKLWDFLSSLNNENSCVA